MLKERLHKTIDTAHLIYLGLIPSAATFFSLLKYGTGYPFLVFIGGIVLVSVYLAVVASYTKESKSLWVSLWVFVDGPVFALLSNYKSLSFSSVFIDSFMIDGTSIWLAIMWLAVSTDRPTKAQRNGTLILGIIALATVIIGFYGYLNEQIFGSLFRSAGLLAGIIETVVVYHFILKMDIVYRDSTAASKYIIAFILIWLAAMIGGINFHNV